MKGARRVYAFDIDTTYLEKNVAENGFQDVIVPVRCVCGNTRDLDYVTMEFDIPEGSILKVDCEGCEYPFLAGTRTLKQYATVIIEYHDGLKFIPRKLRLAGFDVKVKEEGRKHGIIYARR